MQSRTLALVGGLLLLAAFSHAVAAQDASEASLRFFKDLAETRNFSLGLPVAAQPTPDGKGVLFLRGGARDPVLRLYMLHVRSGRVEELLTPEALLEGAEEELSVEEKARRERMRMTLRGFTSFKLSEDGSKILVSLSGKLYVIRRSDKQVTELPSGDDAWINPRFSPDGRYVSAVRANELYVLDIEAKTESQLTTGATETLHHGVAEFVAQEEMGRHTGYWWSPDSSRLVFQETDLEEVEKLYIMVPSHPEEKPHRSFYPRAGTPNARVKLGIIPLEGGDATWIQWDSGRFPYVARVVWEESAPLTLWVQTRDQREQKLLVVDPDTGASRDLLAETDEAWLNLPEAGSLELPYWLPDGSAFLWATEQRGGWQLELRGASGDLVRELTPVGLNVSQVVDLDERARSITALGGPDPRERHIYRVSLRGSKPVKITREAGVHSAIFAKNHRIYVHSFWLSDGTVRAVVRKKNGKLLAEIPSVAEQPPFLPHVEMTRVGKERMYDALLVRPRDFQPDRKYPVLVKVYAGPSHKVVTNLPRAYILAQWMADHGYVVVMLDGRGTPGHGREWERVIKGNLIDIALEDQVAGLRALGEEHPELDMGRVGIVGWSFGGYFSAMATLRRPDVYHCGVAGAPVTDWLDYDTHYTERYLDLPSANPEGYKKSSVLTYASRLERPLMLIHGLTDDNVYFVHTMKLAEAFFLAGRPFDLILLPGTHLLPDPVQKLRLWSRIMDFFNENLGLPLRYTQVRPLPGDTASTGQ